MRIGRILGIDIFVNVSWLFVFALVAWTLAMNIGPLHAVDIGPWPRAVLGVLTSLVFFLCVLAHELAHSLIARARGIPIRGITLFIFGGVSLFEGEAESAPTEAYVSLVGPLTSLGLYLIFCAICNLLAPGANLQLAGHGLRLAYAAACGYLAFANLFIALFNLLPAYPLDGGRILHALLWRIMKNRKLATTITNVVGRLIAGTIVCLGIASTLVDRSGGGLWLTMIGWFLFQAGEVERVAARLGDVLRGHHASEVAQDPPLRLPADSNAADALHELLAQQFHAAPVYIGERCIGIVTLQDLVRVSDPSRTYVTAVMTQLDEVQGIAADADAAEIARKLSRGGQTMLPVRDAQGEIVGFITRESLLAWIAKAPGGPRVRGLK